LQSTCQLLLLQGKGKLFLNAGEPLAGVYFYRFLQLAEAVNGIMEVGDGFVQGVGRKVCQQLLEPAEGQGALVEILLTLGGVQAEASHEVIHSPELSILIQMIKFPIQGGDEMQRQSGIIHTAADEVGDGACVVHQAHRILENMLVDFLQNILRAPIRDDLLGGVDVAVADVLAADAATPHNENNPSKVVSTSKTDNTFFIA